MHDDFANMPTQDQRTLAEGSKGDRSASIDRFAHSLIGRSFGPYTVLSVLGEGGFGVVCVAEQVEPVRRRVALKLLKSELASRELRSRFDAERQALALLDHPGVAKVYDAGVTDEGRPYFAMEYVRGVPINEACDQRMLDMRGRLELFVQVCLAVQHAHHKGIIHRDLKPSNILTVDVDGTLMAKVIDFGIAKAIAQPLTGATLQTEVGRIIGTPEYMSPEQAAGNSDDIDTRSDVYSLGVLLYELLTGTLPIDLRTARGGKPRSSAVHADDASHSGGLAALWELPRMIREVEPPLPSARAKSLQSGDARTLAESALARTRSDNALEAVAKLRRSDSRSLLRQLRGDLDWIVMRCLEKERNRRYDSPAALAADIRRHLEDEPVLAGPPGTLYRTSKFVRRHRTGVGVAAAFLLVMLGSTVLLAIMYFKAESALKRAGEERAKTDATLVFVKQMFQSMDPARAKGRDITVREVLDDAMTRVPDGSPNEVQFAIRSILGESYYVLGRYAEALENFRAARTAAEESLGKEHRETLSVRHNIVASLISMSRTDEAETECKDLYKLKVKAFGGADPDTLDTASLLATIQQDQGDLEGAIATMREVVAAQSQVNGVMDRRTLDSRCGLADMLQYLGKLNEAEAEARDVVTKAEESLGGEDPITLQARSILGSILGDLGRDQEAESELRVVVKLKNKILGETHADAVVAQSALATILRRLGQLDESAKLATHAYEASRIALGPDHVGTMAYQNNLGLIRMEQKEYDAALVLFKDMLERSTRTLSESDTRTLTSMNNLGQCLTLMGKPEEALPYLLDANERIEKIQPPGHWMIGSSRVFLAQCYAKLGRFEEAEKLALSAEEQLRTKMGERHFRTKAARKVLAEVYELWGKPDQAAAWKP